MKKLSRTVTLCFVTLGCIFGFSMLLLIDQGTLETNTQPNLRTPKSSQGTDIYTLEDISSHIWSPDGTKVAYVKAPNGQAWNCELWVADKSSSGAALVNPQLISSEAECDSLLDWKDDWILFRIRHEEGTPSSYYGRNELWRIRCNGTGLTQVTFTETNGIRTTWGNSAYTNRGTANWGNFIPGTNLVYFRAHDGNGYWKAFVCNDNGTDSWYHISDPDYAFDIAMSPTGNKLVWGDSDGFGLPTTLGACNVGGTGRVTIKAFSVRVSPLVLADGNTIVWIETDNIKVINMDGTNERTVLDDEHVYKLYNYDPLEGQALLVGSNRADSNMHVFKINVDDKNITQLTDGLYLDEFPRLSPDGQYLSYLRLPGDFVKETSSSPYPYELVIKKADPIISTSVPGYDIYLLFGIVCVVSILLNRKRLKSIM